VGWWRLDEGEGTVATDSSGYGNHGTVYGDATWVDGKYGKALSFDGTNDYVEILNDSTLNFSASDSFSVSFWFKGNMPSDYPNLVDKCTHAPYAGYVCSLRTITGYCWFQIADGKGNTPYVSNNINVCDDAWHHIVMVRDVASDKIRIYTDGGNTQSATDTTADSLSNTRSLWIGRNWIRSQTIEGTVDEVRIYNRVLSTAEIQEIFQKGPDFSSRLLAKVPKGTTQFIVTLSWQGLGSMNISIESPSKSYTEDVVPVYQKTVYSSSSGDMLNIKRLAVSVTALSSDEDWYVMLEFDDAEDYRITVEILR